MTAAVFVFSAAVLTAVIETPILFAAGYRSRRFVLVCVLVNLATNLTLSLGFGIAGQRPWSALIPAEVAIVLIEWAVLRAVAANGDPVRWVSRPAARLFVFVLLANLTSFLIGLVLPW
ncbi:MAG: hypothetical protein FWF43_08670 [Propionibacteriaceae bacterium]|nr:hypothetical protein [Propionibacteriaceae bacterium]